MLSFFVHQWWLLRWKWRPRRKSRLTLCNHNYLLRLRSCPQCYLYKAPGKWSTADSTRTCLNEAKSGYAAEGSSEIAVRGRRSFPYNSAGCPVSCAMRWDFRSHYASCECATTITSAESIGCHSLYGGWYSCCVRWSLVLGRRRTAHGDAINALGPPHTSICKALS